MFGSHGNLHRILRIGADALDIRQGGAGHHEAAVLHPGLFQLFAALGQPIAVHGDQGQLVPLHLKQRAGVDGAHVGVRHGEDGLVDHAAQHALGQLHGVDAVHHRHFRVILGADAHKVEFALAAADLDAVVQIRADGHDPVGQAADHLAEEAGSHHDGAALGNVGLDIGIDAFLQVIAGYFHIGPGLDQKTLQRGDGAFGGGGAGSDGAGGLEQSLFAGKLHDRSS